MFLFLKNLLFTVLVPGTVAVYIPLRLVRFRPEMLRGEWGLAQVAALVPLLLGAAIYFWCLWDFAFFGRGTPAPIDAPKRLVVRGLYRFVRNPMYVGVLLVIAGWAAFFESRRILLYGAGIALLFHLVVLVIEEPILASRFGESYAQYRREVGRWVPRIRPRRAV
ncbi:MAG TPA: isoprenylcysteine carboxylmethyltransferase family protein [Thermoanaerobaculia bacterium]|jgi:protein-S-isoprenylcysteine O-methyltransferase Ste14